MNALEDKLRDAYCAAAETVRPEVVLRDGVRGLHGHDRRPARRAGNRWSRNRLLVPLAAAIAVAVVAVVASLQARGPGSGQQTPSTSATPGHFFVELNWIVRGDRTNKPTMFVVNATTGAQGAQISLPFPAADLDGVATGDGRTFVVAATVPQSCSTSLYRFRLTADGVPTTITAFATVPGVMDNPSALAVSGNGKIIAYDALVCGQQLSPRRSLLLHCGRTPTPSNCGQSAYLAVVNTATGQTRRWTYRTNTGAGSPVSLSADGRTVAFGTGAAEDWVLRTNAAPGTLAQRGRVAAHNGEFGPSTILGGGPVIAPNGKTMYFATFRIYHDKPVGRDWQLRALNLSTGQTRLVRSLAGLPAPGGPVAVNPTGHYLLVEYITNLASPLTARLAKLDIATGQVTQLTDDGWAAVAW